MPRLLFGVAVLGLCVVARAGGFSLLDWNVSGNGASDWSTNAPQAQAIGRHLLALRPDLVTFQEIPLTNTWRMADWVRAWLPGYALATNSGTDGYLRSVVASRFPIRRSTSWLDGVDLMEFGYTGRFTRDLFEVEVAVPGFEQPLHVFTTHLKSGTAADAVRRRGAEAAAISNYLVTVFLPTHANRPYLLTGDLNEDVRQPPAGSRKPISALANAATGLRLTTPTVPGTSSEPTWSTRTPGLLYRYDYVLPGGRLFSNLVSAELVSARRLDPLLPPLERTDESRASDHLPLRFVFANPYERPFAITGFTVERDRVTLRWEAAPAFTYELQASADGGVWSAVATNLTTLGATLSHTVVRSEPRAWFRVRRTP